MCTSSELYDDGIDASLRQFEIVLDIPCLNKEAKISTGNKTSK